MHYLEHFGIFLSSYSTAINPPPALTPFTISIYECPIRPAAKPAKLVEIVAVPAADAARGFVVEAAFGGRGRGSGRVGWGRGRGLGGAWWGVWGVGGGGLWWGLAILVATLAFLTSWWVYC